MISSPGLKIATVKATNFAPRENCTSLPFKKVFDVAVLLDDSKP